MFTPKWDLHYLNAYWLTCFIDKDCVCLSLQRLTGWSSTPLGLKSQLLGGTSWPRLTWRGSLGSQEGYKHTCRHCRATICMLIHSWFAWHNQLFPGWGSNLPPLWFALLSGTDLLYQQLMVTDSFTTRNQSSHQLWKVTQLYEAVIKHMAGYFHHINVIYYIMKQGEK